MKMFKYLSMAVLLNAFGTALMAKSNLGMSAWGSAAINFGKFTSLSLGVSFSIIAVFFYLVALYMVKKFSVLNALYSFAFAFSYGFFIDIFVFILPNTESYPYFGKFLINIIGLLIMCYGIAIHLRINLAVHPVDVYLIAVQKRLNSIAKGTYLAYGSAFLAALIFGYFSGGIIGIGIGTANTLLFAGVILDFYDKRIRI